MSENFEEEYMDVLQNIEFAIVTVYRQHPDDEIANKHVENAVAGLIRTYQAEVRGKDAPTLRLGPLEQKMFDFAKSMCEWRLGREQFYQTTEDGEEIPFEEGPPPRTVDEIIACLKRIRKSIRFWAKLGGRKGYLIFIDDFFPQ